MHTIWLCETLGLRREWLGNRPKFLCQRSGARLFRWGGITFIFQL